MTENPKTNGLQDAARQFLINHVESQTNKSCLSQRLVTDHPRSLHPDDGGDGVLWFVCFHVLRVNLIENGCGNHGPPNSGYTQRGRC